LSTALETVWRQAQWTGQPVVARVRCRWSYNNGAVTSELFEVRGEGKARCVEVVERKLQ
jgi:hypothetical protein